MDYTYSGSASYPRFEKEMTTLAKALEAKRHVDPKVLSMVKY